MLKQFPNGFEMKRNILKSLSLLFVSIFFILCIQFLLFSVSFAETPSVKIIKPVNNAVFSQNENIAFEGNGFYPEDIMHKPWELIWTSNIDGVIGTVESFEVILTKGNHSITLKAIDYDNSYSTDQISITVE